MLLNQFLILGAVLFCIGVYGVIARKNAVMVLMSIDRVVSGLLFLAGHLRQVDTHRQTHGWH